MASSTSEPRVPASRQLLTRRNLIASTGLVAAAVSAAPLLGRGTAEAAVAAACPPGATAPVPPPAKGPAIPKSGYLVEEIGDRVFWLTDGLYQMIFMTTAEGVVTVDAPPTIGHNIVRAIATVTKSHVTHAIYSHHHADHTGAMVLYEGARFYAQSEVAALLRQTRDPNRPLPDVTFDDHLTVQAGEDRVELAYHGPNHSPGNIFTYLPAQRVLMLVDVVFPGWVPFAYLAESQNIPGWLEAPAQALGYRSTPSSEATSPGWAPVTTWSSSRNTWPISRRRPPARSIPSTSRTSTSPSIRLTRGPSSAATWTASPPRPPTR